MKITLAIVLLSFLGGQNTDMIFKYYDGSGNGYIITKDSIEYLPVKMIESSSGEYDVGEAQKKKIGKHAFQLIKYRFEMIFDNKSIQIKERIMTSSVLVIQKNKKIKEVIIMNCKEQQDLELLLKDVLKN